MALGAFAIIKRKTLAAKCSKQERADDDSIYEEQATPAKSVENVENPTAQ